MRLLTHSIGILAAGGREAPKFGGASIIGGCCAVKKRRALESDKQRHVLELPHIHQPQVRQAQFRDDNQRQQG